MLDFVYKKVASLALINEISFYHLSRRLNSDETTSGENLYTLLTTKNELSSFLLEEDTLDSNAKLEYLLIQLFYRVYEHLTMPEKYIFDNDNPIIRLNDFDRMDARFYIGREEITQGMLGLGA